MRLAHEVEGIDLIVDGHSHTLLEEPIVINGTPIVQAGERGRYLGRAVLYFDAETNDVSLREWECISLKRTEDAPSFGVDQSVYNMLEVFVNKASVHMNQVVGYSDVEYSDSDIRNQFIPLGQIVSNAMKLAFEEGEVDLGIYNSGGIRAGLPQGELRYHNITNVLPFENTIVKVVMNGEVLTRLINHSMDVMVNTGGFLQFCSNVEILENDNRVILINGIEIDKERVYRIATNSYIAAGRDDYLQFMQEAEAVNSGIFERDAMLKYIEKIGL
jgi:5'-nucleotidase/UDP-sugar diphosphatase